jgi:hypothetical protein
LGEVVVLRERESVRVVAGLDNALDKLRPVLVPSDHFHRSEIIKPTLYLQPLQSQEAGLEQQIAQLADNDPHGIVVGGDLLGGGKVPAAEHMAPKVLQPVKQGVFLPFEQELLLYAGVALA